jgi:hypothetical protein
MPGRITPRLFEKRVSAVLADLAGEWQRAGCIRKARRIHADDQLGGQPQSQ